ncbi:DUF4387 domain-containing protein [Alphaproteobacteria bacterium]|nr:DUF4387 domain-containing protein [Alphaproteobacteria bacterium]
MPLLGEKVEKIRSKNAGPFWITIDIFCGSKVIFDEVRVKLDNVRVTNLFQINRKTLNRYEIESLNVIKFSFPRQIIQGDIIDRDMHGAQLAVLLSEMDL